MTEELDYQQQINELIAERDALKAALKGLHDEFCENFPDGEHSAVDYAREILAKTKE